MTRKVSVISSSSPNHTPTTNAASNKHIPPSQTSYMAIVQEWRGKLGLKTLGHDSALGANALKTCVDSNGQMIHELNPGSHAQVLAMGDMNQDFQRIFVGGWLCEKPNMQGLQDICKTLSVGWTYTGTGHADILTSTIYTKIGCATFGGVTSCDLA